jgi:hypothetical protein
VRRRSRSSPARTTHRDCLAPMLATARPSSIEASSNARCAASARPPSGGACSARRCPRTRGRRGAASG